MAINFPNSPTDGQLYLDSNTGNLYKYLSSKGAWTSFANNISTTVSASAPAAPLNGTLWWNSNLGKLFIYYTDGDSNQWVEATIGSTTVDAGLLNSYVGPAYAAANNAANNVTLSYNQANAAFVKANSALQNTNFTLSGNLTTTGIVSDYKGDVRSSPISAQTSSYILVSADNGRTISTNTGVTVPNTVISTGQMFSVFNNSASSITITSAGSITMYLGGSSTTGNRTLATYGIATILCVAANTFVITGAGLT